jgi:hypothetical protein
MAMFGGNVQTQMYVTVQEPICYQWYFVASNDFANTQNSALNILLADQGPVYARAWIMDPSTADAFELNNTAKEPSQVKLCSDTRRRFS